VAIKSLKTYESHARAELIREAALMVSKTHCTACGLAHIVFAGFSELLLLVDSSTHYLQWGCQQLINANAWHCAVL
jgi:hypothetical protein